MSERLLREQEVIDAIEGTDWYEIRNGKLTHGASREEEALYKATDVYTAIENVPSAEPQIIRCKDCKHYDDIFHYCSVRYFEDKRWMLPNDFCSYAERRTDG